jgi:hypothetical protein
MDDQRFSALCQTLDAECLLVARLTNLNRTFHATLGAAEDRHTMDHAALAAQDEQLEALAQQAHVLFEELLTVHRAFEETYPPRDPRLVPSQPRTKLSGLAALEMQDSDTEAGVTST